jgi:dihydroxyacetone kinase-like protein
LIVNRRVHYLLRREGIEIHDTIIGSFCTCQEMAGFSISLMKLNDELRKYYDMPADSLGYRKI